MRGFSKIIPLFMSIWIAGITYAQEGSPRFSLKEAQTYAIKNNATTKNARLDLVSAKKKIWETTAIGLPQITSSVNYQNIIKVPTVTFPGSNGGEDQLIKLGVKETTSLDITLSQLIFSGSYLIGLQASKTYHELLSRSLQKSEIDIKESVANAYYLALVLDENIRIVHSNLENLTKTLNEMQEMNKQGFTEDSDIDQLKLSVNSLENTVRALKRQKEISLYLLKFQMGFDQNQPIELTETLNDYITQASAEFPEPENNIKANINYQLMETQEKLSILNYKKQKSEYLPTLSGFYKHIEKNKSTFDFTTPNIFGFTLAIPVFSSGQKQSLIRQRENDIEKIKNSKQQVEESLKLELNQAYNELQNSFDKYHTEKENIEISKRIYEKNTIKFREGMVTSMDLTNSNNQYLNAQNNFFNAAYAVLGAKLKIDRILNRL